MGNGCARTWNTRVHTCVWSSTGMPRVREVVEEVLTLVLVLALVMVLSCVYGVSVGLCGGGTSDDTRPKRGIAELRAVCTRLGESRGVLITGGAIGDAGEANPVAEEEAGREEVGEMEDNEGGEVSDAVDEELGTPAPTPIPAPAPVPALGMATVPLCLAPSIRSCASLESDIAAMALLGAVSYADTRRAVEAAPAVRDC